ncbi:MAG: hypothetical protein V3T23_08400 [Nitrososphaerales archaeon]
MTERSDDLKRAQKLGMSLDEFQSLVGFDPLDTHAVYTAPSDKDEEKPKKKKKTKAGDGSYGEHTHTKDNPLGLHAHYPGGPLTGGHTHSPNISQGHHTHQYSLEEIKQFKFARPGIMIEVDGSHTHKEVKFNNAPDGAHPHKEDNLGLPSEDRVNRIVNLDSKGDTI